jgi:hypothetical protein
LALRAHVEREELAQYRHQTLFLAPFAAEGSKTAANRIRDLGRELRARRAGGLLEEGDDDDGDA